MRSFPRLKWALIAFALLSVTFACKKLLPSILHFNLDIPEQKFTVPVLDTTGAQVMANMPIHVNLDSAIAANTSGAYGASYARLTKFRLSVTSPGKYMDAFNNISVWLVDPTLGNAKIAYYDSIPDGVINLDLKTLDINLVEYLKKNPCTLQVQTTLDSQKNDTLDMKANMSFDVQVSKK